MFRAAVSRSNYSRIPTTEAVSGTLSMYIWYKYVYIYIPYNPPFVHRPDEYVSRGGFPLELLEDPDDGNRFWDAADGGTTATVALLIRGSTLVLATVGDSSAAVLGRKADGGAEVRIYIYIYINKYLFINHRNSGAADPRLDAGPSNGGRLVSRGAGAKGGWWRRGANIYIYIYINKYLFINHRDSGAADPRLNAGPSNGGRLVSRGAGAKGGWQRRGAGYIYIYLSIYLCMYIYIYIHRDGRAADPRLDAGPRHCW